MTMALQRTSFILHFAGTAKAKFSRFWRWWMAELRALIPAGLARRLEREASMIDLSLTDTRIALLKVGINSLSEEKHQELTGMDSAGRLQAVQELLRARKGDIRVVLDAEQVLRKRLTLPEATEENLRQVLAFDMDRQTPFKAAQIYYDARVVRRDRAAGMIDVELCLALRDDVDKLLTPLREAKVAIGAIGLRDDIAGPAPHLNLLAADQRAPHRLRAQQIVNRALIVLTGLLTVAVVILPIWQKREVVIAMLPLLHQARSEAAITDGINSNYVRASAEYNFIMSKKQGIQPAIALLEEVTKILPDNTWAQIFELRQTQKTREIQLTGETASASKLIEIFEQSPMLQNSVQRAQVTKGAAPGTERYQIAAEVKPRILSDPNAPAEVAVTGEAVSTAAADFVGPPLPGKSPAPTPSKGSKP